MPKPSVDTLLADPDFQSMDVEGQREILSEVSPAFKGFTVEKQNEALADVSNLRNTPNVEPEVASIPSTPSAQEQFAQQYIASAQRPLTQKVASGLGSLISGLGGTIKGGIEGSAETLADAIKTAQNNEVLSALNAVPVSSGVGLGTALAAAPNLAQTGLESAGRAVTDVYDAGKQLGPYLADLIQGRAQPPSLLPRTPTSGEARAAFERSEFSKTQARPEGAVVPEVFGEANIPLAQALTLLAGEEALLPALGRRGAIRAATETAGDIASGTARAASRIPATTTDVLAFATGADRAPALFKEKILSNGFDDVLPDFARAKNKSGAEGVNQARKDLNKETFDIIKPVLKEADGKSVIFSEDNIMARADEALSNPEASYSIATPEVRNSALSVSRKYIKGLTPENILARYNDVSDQLISFWKSPDQARFANRVKGLEAIRDTLSSNIKTILEERGVDPNLWSKSGKINEFADQIAKNHGAESAAFASKRGEGVLSKKGVQGGDIISRIPLAGTAIRAAGNVVERIKGGTPALIDSRLDDLFKDIKASPSIPPALPLPPRALPPVIPPEDLNAIIAQSLSEQGPRAAIPSNELDDIIRQLSQEQAGNQLGQQF